MDSVYVSLSGFGFFSGHVRLSINLRGIRIKLRGAAKGTMTIGVKGKEI
jgi:hypothetical protein